MTDDRHLIDPDLLAIMQCPACAGELGERHEPPALVCASCGRAYAVENGIPIMLVDEAEPPLGDEAELPSNDEPEPPSNDEAEPPNGD